MLGALVSAAAFVNGSRALQAGETLLVQNPRTAVEPGVQLTCYGPFFPPASARSLHQMLPVVNMGIVHHMIMFGGDNDYVPGAKPRANSDYCYRGSIVYAWARTGQQSPIGLNFDDSGSQGDAYAVGPGSSIRWFALQIHYQQLGAKAVDDTSGVKLWFRESPPVRPLEVGLPRVSNSNAADCSARAPARTTNGQ